MKVIVLKDIKVKDSEGEEVFFASTIDNVKRAFISFVFSLFNDSTYLFINLFGKAALPEELETFMDEVFPKDRRIVILDQELTGALKLPPNVYFHDEQDWVKIEEEKVFIEGIEIPTDFSSSPINNFPSCVIYENRAFSKVNLDFPSLKLNILEEFEESPLNLINEKELFVLNTFLTPLEVEKIRHLKNVKALYEEIPESPICFRKYLERLEKRVEKMVVLEMLRGE
ncbi:MAG: hypothetical protein DRP38_05585 [Thermotogae bacterium]|nr:MAG: hypothetical protein B5M49_04635 [Thermotoga sp. 4484_232]RKX40446.1 MAG: hypothetical protein DRP23_03050 [Thermotogota bacterium]RKX47992.1 MAG: hypothetical protein DRP38_05585 [Thermotogota bacterium]RKX53063.1 MAG: hypothetical protein DRP25_01120 [Thermotoga sp.]RKX56635.1 MAG: hypothetical protein DRP24_02730 [Thermotoga sp.]